MSRTPIITSYQSAVIQSRANRVIKETLAAALKKYGITMMQWSIIGLVADAGSKGVRISDLARTLDTSLAFVTTTVNVLEAKGFVYRQGHTVDNRAKLVRISQEFTPKVADIETDLAKHQKQAIFGHFNPQDVVTYFKVLQQIAERA
jgi:DNA-binding MarR family transcriptional regulator